MIEALPPVSPQKKGKVERLIPYIRRLYQAHPEQWWGMEESQDYLNSKLLMANKKPHGSTRKRPLEVFQEIEQETLKALPEVHYDTEYYQQFRVASEIR